jgi:hypothetical protein
MLRRCRDRLAVSHSILNKWKNYFCQLSSVDGVNDVRQSKVHTAELSGADPRPLEVEICIEMSDRYKSPDIDQIPAEAIGTGANALRCEM